MSDTTRDYLERSIATAVQAGIASWLVGAGWKAALAAAVGAALAVVKAAAKSRLDRKPVES